MLRLTLCETEKVVTRHTVRERASAVCPMLGSHFLHKVLLISSSGQDLPLRPWVPEPHVPLIQFPLHRRQSYTEGETAGHNHTGKHTIYVHEAMTSHSPPLWYIHKYTHTHTYVRTYVCTNSTRWEWLKLRLKSGVTVLSLSGWFEPNIFTTEIPIYCKYSQPHTHPAPAQHSTHLV